MKPYTAMIGVLVGGRYDSINHRYVLYVACFENEVCRIIMDAPRAVTYIDNLILKHAGNRVKVTLSNVVVRNSAGEIDYIMSDIQKI